MVEPAAAGGAIPTPAATPPGPGERWTILRLILWSAAYLKEKGVEQARLDAEHLLAHTLGTQRLQLYLQHERPLGPEELAAFKPLLLRRAAREPLQYIVGRTSFRELELATDRRALIPRPETEVLVEVVLEWARRRARAEGEASGAKTLTAVDVGTGSGCIALSLAREGPFRRVLATDLSREALGLAGDNARALGLEGVVELREGDLLGALAEERFDALVSNPPYISESEKGQLEPEVLGHEPHAALFSGGDGLEVVRAIVAGAGEHLRSDGLLALEVGAGQSRVVAGLVEATGAFLAPRVHRDLSGRARIVTAVKVG